MSGKSEATPEFDAAALKYHQCDRKRKYADLSEAERAIVEMAARQKQDPSSLHPYVCNHCGLFHVGHLPNQSGLHMARIRKKYKREVLKKKGGAT